MISVEAYTKDQNLSVRELFFRAWKSSQGSERSPGWAQIGVILDEIKLYEETKSTPYYVLKHINHWRGRYVHPA